MLIYLHVKNIAIIDEIEIDFSKGFSVLSGETGAGKSIIIGSINAVLGSRMNKDFLRKGANYALIEAVFMCNSIKVKEILDDLGIDSLDELVISRKISNNGRSVFRINGQIVNRENVKELSNYLIDIHSQLENQSLLDKKNHINLLDKYLLSQLGKVLNELDGLYKEYLALKRELKGSDMDPEYRRRHISFLEFEINEINEAELKVDEDIQLKEQYTKLSNLNKIKEVLSYVDSTLNYKEHSGGLRNSFTEILGQLSVVKKYDEAIDNLYLQAEQMDLLMTDFAREIIDYSEELEIDGSEFDSISNRLDLINKLKSKYGENISDILEFKTQKENEYNQLVSYEENLEKYSQNLKIIEEKIIDKSKVISKVRSKGAVVLEKAIKQALQDLNLPNISFKIQIDQNTSFSKTGIDNVEFLIATNLGENLKPLNKIASGGELSRIMLAIKSILADHDEIDTMIFDEIDTGISGRTAQKVAEKMYRISNSKQLICITHLPQIAAMSDYHYVIVKEDVKDRSIVNVNQLSEDAIPEELGRLLGGAKITDAVMESAKEMKNLANQYKKNQL